MYILKNSLISILRNKGRNILIGLIILTIACSTTVTLAIRNTANNIVRHSQWRQGGNHEEYGKNNGKTGRSVQGQRLRLSRI